MEVPGPNDYFRVPSSPSWFFALDTLVPLSPDPSSPSSVYSLDFEDLPIFFVDSVRPDSFQLESEWCATPIFGDYYREMLEANIDSVSSLSSVVSYGSFGPKSAYPADETELPYDPVQDAASVSPIVHSTTRLEAIPEETLDSSHPMAQLHQTTTHSRKHANKEDLNPHWNRDTSRNGQLMDTTNTDTRIAESQRKHSPEQVDPRIPAVSALTYGTKRKGLRKENHRPAPVGPAEFVWLHGVFIDLLIDQEGFRSTAPSFRYSGVKYSGDTCTVSFRPSTKQAFYFHYSPFDSLPILRRVTVHGEEARDYISKQAQLTLKSNGAYSVQGSEVSSLSGMDHSQASSQLGLDRNSKLEWEFQYVVSDRLDVYGNVVDAEKKFVPLAFRCSPWLLHPSQGKRINLVHMFKKGVATKLTAEFLPPGQGSSAESREVLGATTRNHRRVQSQAVGGVGMNMDSAPGSVGPGHRNKATHPAGMLRRRASSVGMAA